MFAKDIEINKIASLLKILPDESNVTAILLDEGYSVKTIVTLSDVGDIEREKKRKKLLNDYQEWSKEMLEREKKQNI